MSDLWHFIDSVYARYADDHRGKTEHMRIREKKLVSVKFKDAESDAVCFKVINSNPSTLVSATLHNVVISKKPGESFFRMWCGDTKIAKEDGEKEDRCNFWQNHSKNGESISYACKHIVYVLDNIGEKGRREVEQMLSPFSQPSFSHGDLGYILDLWEPAFIYGPTGSGKSHEVRHMVKRYTDACVAPQDIEYVKDTLNRIAKLGAGYVGNQNQRLNEVFPRNFYSEGMNQDIARMVALFLKRYFIRQLAA